MLWHNRRRQCKTAIRQNLAQDIPIIRSKTISRSARSRFGKRHNFRRIASFADAGASFIARRITAPHNAANAPKPTCAWYAPVVRISNFVNAQRMNRRGHCGFAMPPPVYAQVRQPSRTAAGAKTATGFFRRHSLSPRYQTRICRLAVSADAYTVTKFGGFFCGCAILPLSCVTINSSRLPVRMRAFFVRSVRAIIRLVRRPLCPGQMPKLRRKDRISDSDIAKARAMPACC